MSDRAFVYVRQSVQHEEGIERGLAKARALIENRNWSLAREPFVDNAVSASKSRDSGTRWADMLAAIREGEADVIVGVDLDRLVRGIRDLQTLIDLGVRVVTVDGEIDLTTADGEFRATMLAGIARFEVRRKGERQRRANAFRIQNGLPVAGGRRRFGFKSDHLTVIKDEAKWIRHAYKQVAAGKSIRSVARDFNEGGVACVTKGTWNAPRIQKLLKNPAYRGFVIHNGEAWQSDKMPVVVQPALAAKVDAIMADPSRRKSPGAGRSALLSGIVFCGTCGAPLTSAGTKSRGEQIRTYACSAVKDGRATASGHPSIRREILDSKVRFEVVSAFMSGSSELLAMPVAADIGEIETELAELFAFKADLLAGIGPDTGVSMADLRPQLVDVSQKVETLTARRQAMLAKSAHAEMLTYARKSILLPNKRVDMDAAAFVWGQLQERFDGLDLDTKRTVISDLLSVSVAPGRGSSRVDVEHLIVKSLNDAVAAVGE